MSNKVKTMIKHVIEENAVDFKNTTSRALYEKIGNRMKEEYKNVAKDLFKQPKKAEE